jgi:hypothetical protein
MSAMPGSPASSIVRRSSSRTASAGHKRSMGGE